MNNPPNGWSVCRLENIADDISYGYTAKSDSFSGDARMLRITDIQDGRVVWGKVPFCQIGAGELKKYSLQNQDLVFARTGATVGKSYLVCNVPENVVFASYLIRVRLKDSGLSRYLSHFFGSYLYWGQISDFSAGIGQPNVNGSKLKNLVVPIAPEKEQQRIADKLDTVLTRVDACRDRLARVAPLLKRFRQSVLAAATSGRLTEDWRESNKLVASGLDVIQADSAAKAALILKNPSLGKKKSTTHCKLDENYTFRIPQQWRFSTWGALSEWITYGFTRPMPATSTGKRLLTAKDIHPFDIRIEYSGWTDDNSYADLSEKDKPILGDLLITKDGSIGRAAIVKTRDSFCINQSVAVCWLRSTCMNRSYLELVANSDFTQRFVMDMAKGMAIQHLSIVDFACCPVPVPALIEQTEIVRRVETLFAFADRLEARLKTAQTATDRLTPALLAKAFRGELVPQDPNDEPAAELLKRLAASRDAAPKAKRGRRSATADTTS